MKVLSIGLSLIFAALGLLAGVLDAYAVALRLGMVKTLPPVIADMATLMVAMPNWRLVFLAVFSLLIFHVARMLNRGRPAFAMVLALGMMFTGLWSGLSRLPAYDRVFDANAERVILLLQLVLIGLVWLVDPPRMEAAPRPGGDRPLRPGGRLADDPAD